MIACANHLISSNLSAEVLGGTIYSVKFTEGLLRCCRSIASHLYLSGAMALSDNLL